MTSDLTNTQASTDQTTDLATEAIEVRSQDPLGKWFFRLMLGLFIVTVFGKLWQWSEAKIVPRPNMAKAGMWYDAQHAATMYISEDPNDPIILFVQSPDGYIEGFYVRITARSESTNWAGSVVCYNSGAPVGHLTVFGLNDPQVMFFRNDGSQFVLKFQRTV